MMAKEDDPFLWVLWVSPCFQGRTVKFAVGVSSSYSLERIWGKRFVRKFVGLLAAPSWDPTHQILSVFSCCCSHGIRGAIVYLPTLIVDFMVNVGKYASPTHGMILETVQNKRFLHVEYNFDRKEFGEIL